MAADSPPVIGGLESHTKISPSLAGRILISELNCAACHSSDQASLAPKGGPLLSEAGARLNPAHLQRFIAHPDRIKPGTTMPDVLAHLPDDERQQTALALAHYLSSLGAKPLVFERPAAEAVARGKTLYHSVGCVACHAPEAGAAGSVPLGPVEEKYSLASLTAFIEDPLAARPGGRMPDLNLSHFEAVDIASYLLRQQPAAMESFTPDAKLAERGKVYFAQYRCDACHAVSGQRAPQPLTALAKLRPDQGCLADAPGAGPRYSLSAGQRAAIQAALGAGLEPPGVAENIELTLTRLNCIACHQREKIGGVPASRTAFFLSADENLGEQGRLPPPLTGVGAKLRREWLREVLFNGASARPYLRTRMPKFGEANTAPLVDWLKQLDQLPVAKFERAREAEKPREIGRELAGSKYFNCIACHTFRERSSASVRALDLTTMSARLEENWFHHYISAPQRFSPLTIMPSFWPDGESTLKDMLGGDPGKQCDALWRYLAQGPEANEPRGLSLEPLVIAVKDEAVMLRRNYPGIGKRGIGVGYPSGINLSFDAGQMRLGSIWSGGFIEASGVWRGQGAGEVRLLGKDTVSFPAGPALAVLETATAAWPVKPAKQAEGFQFKGYALDTRQRPTFRYQFGSLSVTDCFLDVKDAAPKAHFARTLSFPEGKPPAGLYLRVAMDKRIEPRGEREFEVPGKLRLRLPVEGILRDAAEGRELLMPVTGTESFTIEYHLMGTP